MSGRLHLGGCRARSRAEHLRERPVIARELKILTIGECLTLLRDHHFGRVGFVDTVGVLPVIIPVNYVWDDDAVVFRTDAGSKLRAGARGAPVAFEIDGLDQQRRIGWSVVVRGHAGEVTNPDRLAELSRLPLVAWSPRAKPRYVRITPSHVIGREISVFGLPAHWWAENS